MASIITPAGTLLWSAISKPRDFQDDGKFSYSAKLVLPAGPEAEKLKAQIEAVHQIPAILNSVNSWREKIGKKKFLAKKVKLQDLPYEDELDPETEEETGRTIFKFKLAANNKRGPVFLPVVDAHKNPVGEEVWNGSVVKIAFKFNQWGMDTGAIGTQLKMTAVQVLQLSSGNGDDDAADAFDEEEGFTSTMPADDPDELPAPAVEETPLPETAEDDEF